MEMPGNNTRILYNEGNMICMPKKSKQTMINFPSFFFVPNPFRFVFSMLEGTIFNVFGIIKLITRRHDQISTNKILNQLYAP